MYIKCHSTLWTYISLYHFFQCDLKFSMSVGGISVGFSGMERKVFGRWRNFKENSRTHVSSSYIGEISSAFTRGIVGLVPSDGPIEIYKNFLGIFFNFNFITNFQVWSFLWVTRSFLELPFLGNDKGSFVTIKKLLTGGRGRFGVWWTLSFSIWNIPIKINIIIIIFNFVHWNIRRWTKLI